MAKFWISTLLCLLATTTIAQTIALKAEAKVKGIHLLLGDIAAVDDEALANISLGRTPEIGQSHMYYREDIIMLLEEHGFATNSIVWQGDAVSVQTQTMGVHPQDLIELVREYVSLSLPRNIEEFRCSVVHAPSKTIFIPAPSRKIRIIPQITRKGKTFGHLPVEIALEVDSQIIRTVRLLLEIRGFARVWTTRNAIPAKTTIRKSHLVKKRVEITSVTEPVFSLANIVGQRTRHTLGVSHIISAKDIERVPLVRRGSDVRVYFKTGNLRVRVMAQALQDGYRNDIIRVKNSTSRQIITTRVVMRNLVVPISEKRSTP